MITGIKSEGRFVQVIFTNQRERVVRWESICIRNDENFGFGGTLGRSIKCNVTLVRNIFPRCLMNGEINM